MATNLQGSSHRPRAVGFRLRNRKGFIYELREILKLVKEINDKIAELADKIYEDENERG